MIIQSFFEEYLFFIALTFILVLSGLTARFLILALGFAKLQKGVFVIDELTSHLLVRKGFLQTFIRIGTWNILVSSIVICSGIISLGTLPLVWAFLNLGLFFLDPVLFKRYLYPWIEETANILSAALGAWMGQNLHEFLNVLPVFVWTFMSIFILYMISALLETLKIHPGVKRLNFCSFFIFRAASEILLLSSMKAEPWGR